MEMLFDEKQIRAVFLFKFKMGSNAVETARNINNAFGSEASKECTKQWWFKKFCKGDKSLEDEEHSGWSLEVDNNQVRGSREGNGNPLQYSCLEKPRDGGAWWALVYGVTQSRTRLKRLSSSSSSKASILRRSACFIVQLSHPHMTTRKTIALTRQIFVDKVMSLRVNMLSRLLITLLPRSKHLLISWLQSPSQ